MFLFWGYVIDPIPRRVKGGSLRHKHLINILKLNSKTENNITINYK